MRITEMYSYNNYIDNLQDTMSRLERLARKVSNGKELNYPSDAPEKAGRLINIRESLNNINQYKKNLDETTKYLNISESTIGSMYAIIERAKNMAIKGANDTYSAQDRIIMAGEVDNMLKELIALGNTQIEGKYIFSGFMTATKPFNEIYSGTDITGVIYSGDSGLMPEEVYKGELVNKNIPGDVFILSTNIFNVLISLRDNLRNNNTSGITADIENCKQAMDVLLSIRTDLGARIKRTEDIDARITSIKDTFTKLQSSIEDVDMPEVITRFQLQQNVYQAAITSISKLLQQTTLADILR